MSEPGFHADVERGHQAGAVRSLVGQVTRANQPRNQQLRRLFHDRLERLDTAHASGGLDVGPCPRLRERRQLGVRAVLDLQPVGEVAGARHNCHARPVLDHHEHQPGAKLTIRIGRNRRQHPGQVHTRELDVREVIALRIHGPCLGHRAEHLGRIKSDHIAGAAQPDHDFRCHGFGAFEVQSQSHGQLGPSGRVRVQRIHLRDQSGQALPQIRQVRVMGERTHGAVSAVLTSWAGTTCTAPR